MIMMNPKAWTWVFSSSPSRMSSSLPAASTYEALAAWVVSQGGQMSDAVAFENSKDCIGAGLIAARDIKVAAFLLRQTSSYFFCPKHCPVLIWLCFCHCSSTFVCRLLFSISHMRAW
jgi:hypothetical protein